MARVVRDRNPPFLTRTLLHRAVGLDTGGVRSVSDRTESESTKPENYLKWYLASVLLCQVEEKLGKLIVEGLGEGILAHQHISKNVEFKKKNIILSENGFIFVHEVGLLSWGGEFYADVFVFSSLFPFFFMVPVALDL